VFLINSRLGHCAATSGRSLRMGVHLQRHPIFRSYGVRLPSSLARVRSSTLGFSPSPPVSVCGTVTHVSDHEAFLDGRGAAKFPSTRLKSPSLSALNNRGGFTCPCLAYGVGRTMSNRHDSHTFPCPPLALKRDVGGTGILTRCPSPAPCGYGLGPPNPTPTDVA
jgi:hypothetical protein